MKIKLEFLLSDLKAANIACEKMLLARVENSNIHFLAKKDTDLGQLEGATAIEKTNMINEAGRGVLIGAGLGLLGGVYVLAVPAWITYSPLWFTDAHWSVILTITCIFGAVAVAAAYAMFGINIFNSDHKAFKTKIDNGAILMIVTVPIYRAKEIRNIMKCPIKLG
jgi:hypothetical protein